MYLGVTMNNTRENFVDGNIWLRGLQMILFFIAWNIAELIIALLAIFQFVSALFTGSVNEPLLQFGKNTSKYVQEVFDFLTFNTEEKPFPFSDWPDEDPGGEVWLDDIEDAEFEEVTEVANADEVKSDEAGGDTADQ